MNVPPGKQAAEGPAAHSDWKQTRNEMLRSKNRWFRLALDLHQFYLTTALHVVLTVMLGLSAYFGFLPPSVAWICISALAFSDAVLYAILRSGYNLRFANPHLMVPRALVVIAILLYAQIYAGPTKTCCALGIFTTFVYAGSHAGLRSMLRLNLLTTLAYAATLPLIRRVEGAHYDAHAELLNGLSFAVALPAAVIAGGAISTLRHHLADSNSRLMEMASTDELTGIHNRRYLLDMMQHESQRILRSGTTFCVCLLDIDHFKRLNDAYGHAAGDEVLKSFVDTANTAMRQGDMFGRWGGEEFVLFMPHSTLAMARHAAERIRGAVQELPLDQLAPGLRISVSIGAAEYAAGEPIPDLIERADQALYRAKQAGRNRVEAATPRLVTTS